MEVVSVTAIAPASDLPMTGVRVLVDGQEVSEPYLAVFEISNSGSKPILAADFEGDIQLSAGAKAKVMRAQFVSAVPGSLASSVQVKEGIAHIQPVLLNRGDRMRFAVVTSGGKPVPQARARVAGVADVQVSESVSPDKDTPKRYWTRQVVGIGLLTMYMAFAGLIFSGWRRHRNLKVSYVIAGLVSCTGSVLVLRLATEGPVWSNLAYYFVTATLLSIPFDIRVQKLLRPARPQG